MPLSELQCEALDMAKEDQKLILRGSRQCRTRYVRSTSGILATRLRSRLVADLPGEHSRHDDFGPFPALPSHPSVLCLSGPKQEFHIQA